MSQTQFSADDRHYGSEFAAILEASPDAILVAARNGVVQEINPAGLEMLEADSAEELGGTPLADFVCAEHREAFDACVKALWRGERSRGEFETIGRRGRRRWVEMHAAPLRNAKGEEFSFLWTLRDNTVRRELDRQFIQAQKMEVVGHLAGGVAHDFNNMLGIILGYTELLLDGVPAGTPRHEQTLAVFHTAERAAALTQQLLIYSRKQTPRPGFRPSARESPPC